MNVVPNIGKMIRMKSLKPINSDERPHSTDELV